MIKIHTRAHIKIVKLRKLLYTNYIPFLLILISLHVSAQPSGGPYGPISQTYELPENAGKIFYVSPNGTSKDTGESINRPTTLEAAIGRVKTGDAIILRGGTYRIGNLFLNQGIIIQPYKNEQPVLKGTYIATDWKDLGNGLWVTSWPRLFPSSPLKWWMRHRQGKDTPLYRFNNDMVFIDGKFLQAVGWEGEIDENSYCIDYDTGEIYIGVNPAKHMVEITAFDVALLRTTRMCHDKISDKKGPVIRGITFIQYANRAIEIEGTVPEGPENESDFGKDVTGTIIEHCDISFCSRVGAYLRGDDSILRHCRVSDTSTEGIYLISSCDVLIEKNIFTRNNIENITGYFPAAVKIFNQSCRVTCRDNLIIDHPNSNGIWYDVGCVDGRFINNWVQDVGNINRPYSKKQLWPCDAGFFFEISKGAICAGNIFVNCDHGIWVLNSSNVYITRNTLINSTVCIGRTDRVAEGDVFGWHADTGPRVDERDGHIFINNLLTANETFRRPLLNIWQPADLCKRLSKPIVKQLDYNIYVNSSDIPLDPLIMWSPVKNDDCQLLFKSIKDLQKLHSKFSGHSQYYAEYFGPLFKSRELGNYQLLKSFPGSTKAARLPDTILEILGKSKKDIQYAGAYPPVE